jgi:hypothetical protein
MDDDLKHGHAVQIDPGATTLPLERDFVVPESSDNRHFLATLWPARDSEALRPSSNADETRSTQEQGWSKDFSGPIKVPDKGARSSFVARKSWLGAVGEVKPDSFVARLSAVRGGEADLETEVYLDEVAEFDRTLLRPGALFYLSVGHERQAAGQVRQVASVQFRRVPSYSQDDILSAEQRARSLLAEFEAATSSEYEPK